MTMAQECTTLPLSCGQVWIRWRKKEATITIFEGSIDKSVASGSGLKHEGLTSQQALGAVIAHEIVHATDKKEIAKDLKYESQRKLNPAREVKPNEIERKVMEEYKK